MRKRSEATAAKLPDAVVEKSRELQDEMKKPADVAPLFATAHGPSDELQAIAERKYVRIDMAEAERLEKELTLDEVDLTSYSAIMKAINRGEDNARRAHDLFLNAKAEVALWEIDAEQTLAAMRTAARDRLELAKEERGGKGKTITEADVTAMMAELYPDEWKAQTVQRHKYKGVVAHFEKLSELWIMRCRTLGLMLAHLRK